MVACYVRVSTAEQKEHGYSIDEQIDRLKKYCEALNLGEPKVYNDAGFSGASIERPALQLLIRDIKLHKYNKVLVYKLDRLSRSQKDTLMLIEDVLLSNGCDFVSISENFDTSTPLGRAMIGILAVFAQLEREQIKERMSMGREARAKKGKYAGSWLHPIGYDYIDGELIVNEFEKPQIIQIFTDYSQGLKSIKIAERLNNAGMTHKYGKWSERVVRTCLSKKTYIGYVSFKGEWYKGTHEPIISEELFYKVQGMLTSSDTEWKAGHSRAGHPYSYLGGMMICKQCGNKYFKFQRKTQGYVYQKYCCYGRYPRKKDNHFHCRNMNWNMAELDELVFNEIRKLSFETTVKRSKTPDKTHAIDEKIKSLDKQLERLMNLYTLEEIPLDILQKKIHDINDQKIKLENEKAIDNSTPIEELERVKNSFDDILESGDIDDVRLAISTLIDHIELDNEDVTIFWNFS